MAIAGLILGYIGLAVSLAVVASLSMAGRAMVEVVREAQLQNPPVHGWQLPSEDAADLRGMPRSQGIPDASTSGPTVTLIISRNESFPEERYSLTAEFAGMGEMFSFVCGGGNKEMDLDLQSDVVKATGKLRIMAPHEVEISVTANCTKPFRLGLRGFKTSEVKVDGRAYNDSKTISPGEQKVVISGGV